MKIKTTPFLLLLLFSNQIYADRQHVDETKSAKPDGFVHINIVRGDLSIEGWDRDEIRVNGELDERTKEFIFDVSDNETRIDVRIEDGNSWWGSNDASDLAISVPRGSNVDVSVVSTDVNASNIRGGIKIGSVSGDLDIQDMSDRIDLRTVSGDVELRKSTGRTRIKTVSGDVETYDTDGQGIYHTVSGDVLVSNGGADLELESVSGEIEVEDTVYKTLRGHSVSGEIDIAGEMLADGMVEFDSVSGSIKLGVGKNAIGKFELETSSGRIRNRLTSDEARTSEYARGQKLRFTTGAGASDVIITSRSGDITLEP